MAKAGSVRLEWARLGAQARLKEIEEERETILAAFPELRRSGSGEPRRVSTRARRAMSEGMRRYWAKRRKQKLA